MTWNSIWNAGDQFVFLQETWLDSSVEPLPYFTDYIELSRRDRENQSGYGEIASLARADLTNILFLEDADKTEKTWHAYHTVIEFFFYEIDIDLLAPINR